MATPGEVELDGLIQALLRDSRPVWLPRFDAGAGRYDMVRIAALGEDLQTGAFGIREPRAALPAVPPDERSGSGVVWLVPGVAFDLAGHRLGRGRGYYDRLLRGARGVRIGVAWDWQVIAQVPHTDHDEAMHWIVTETRTIACRGSAG
jgi:5-formyltetrahydrofolate cyclo-ligase